MSWFEVDKEGLRGLVAGREKSGLLFELVQNAWDQNVHEVNLSLESLPGGRQARIAVEDDDPNGFADLKDAYTLFADTAKRKNPEQRGRFNLGEKLVLALARRATVVSTQGGVEFTPEGRRRLRTKRERGSLVTVELTLTKGEIAAMTEAVHRLIPPPHIRTRFNGELLPAREPVREFSATLPTVVADHEGVLRRVERSTVLRLYLPRPDETAGIFELGIPVVETGDKYHVDIQQKVPLNPDRDNVPPAYLRKLRTLVLNEMHAELDPDEARQPWVRDGLSDRLVADDAVRSATTLRFGERAVAYDPSDAEANKRAVAAGYTVVHGGSLSKDEWSNVRRAGDLLLPAGKVTPSPKPSHPDGEELRLLPRAKWTAEIVATVSYLERLAAELIGGRVRVRLANDREWQFAGCYGGRELTVNLARLGRAWFSGERMVEVHDFLIHELGHEYEGDHLSEDYYRALTRLGAQMVALALERPQLFCWGGPFRNESALRGR